MDTAKALDAIASLAELPARFEEGENLLRALARLVGGDPAVCEVARMMRLPGSLNSKHGDAIKVVISKAGDRIDDNPDIEAMVRGSPVLLQKDKALSPSVARERNLFDEYAACLGFSEPVDVEQRLRAMRYRGAGDSGIHITQLSTTASLPQAGMSESEAVRRVLAATKVVAPPGWDWKLEESKLDCICNTWLEKHPGAPLRWP
jgi:hypothetical protein